MLDAVLLTLRQHLHGKRWMVLALLFLLPAGLAILVARDGADVPGRFLEFVLMWILIPQALLPLVALLYASGIIQDEQEEQTITYLLIRPIPKWLMYAVKMAATWTTTVLLVIALTVLTYAAIYVQSGRRNFRGVLPMLARLRDSLAGRDRVLQLVRFDEPVDEAHFGGRHALHGDRGGLVGNLPLSVRMITIIYYTRLIAYRTLDFVVTWPSGAERRRRGIGVVIRHPEPIQVSPITRSSRRACWFWFRAALRLPRSRVGSVRGVNFTSKRRKRHSSDTLISRVGQYFIRAEQSITLVR